MYKYKLMDEIMILVIKIHFSSFVKNRSTEKCHFSFVWTWTNVILYWFLISLRHAFCDILPVEFRWENRNLVTLNVLKYKSGVFILHFHSYITFLSQCLHSLKLLCLLCLPLFICYYLPLVNCRFKCPWVYQRKLP